MVGVSFWEAEACCAWAGGRLPREEEWEAAACGPHGFRYPWGDDREDGIYNIRKPHDVTWPVGLFPRARQAELGIEDLGIIWEWCGSLYDTSDINDLDAFRMLRDDYREAIGRSDFRSGKDPGSRDEYFGFRVVCSPINEH